jgi:hypothetical protein
MKKAIWSKWWQLKKIFNFTCLKDTGIGVEENLQNKIFDRFSQIRAKMEQQFILQYLLLSQKHL